MWAKTISKSQLVAEPLAHRVLKARRFQLQRRANQPVLGREAVNETTLADPRTLGDGIERESSAAGFEDHALGGIQYPVPINFLFPRQI